MIRPVLNICLIGAVCGLVLSATQAMTRSHIDENRLRQAQALLIDMAGWDIQLDGEWRSASLNLCPDGYFVRGSQPGYTGPIEFVLLWEPARGLTLRVSNHRETPGIGDFIDHNRSDWITSMDGASLDRWAALDNVTGATVTTNAVRSALTEHGPVLMEQCR